MNAASTPITCDARRACSSINNSETRLTLACIALTLIAAALALGDIGSIVLERFHARAWPSFAEQLVFIAIVAFLVYGNLVYQVARLGSLRRGLDEAEVPPSSGRWFTGRAPSLTVLIPSYKEEPQVVLQTMLAAALMDYPAKRIVLLIDDAPVPASDADRLLLAQARSLAKRAGDLLRPARLRCEARLRLLQRASADIDLSREARNLAELHLDCADHLEELALGFAGGDHAQHFFVERILRAPAASLRQRARILMQEARRGASATNLPQLITEHRRLAGLFNAEFECFERKRFANLSHAPNKAMNINSYLALMGRRVCVESRDGGSAVIRDARDIEDGYTVPAADYVITLDADSLLMGDYALRLVSWMEEPGNQRVAIAQTPYSAFPNATSRVERIAGITTDIQHLIHQGSTWYGGTYWVGANALIRKRALDEIAVAEIEDGKEVVKFIQDRTVIEDTESTVDLLRKGWTLYNYPERLAYSATPPDFGSLLIQRRRWANGGLIILGKLLSYFARGPRTVARALQAFVQVHYLTSLAGVSAGVTMLILYPFEDAMRSLWLPLAALPYFYLYGRDMTQIGYRWSDLPRVYALNLLLLPVHLGGVVKSLHQLVTGHRTPFRRTPKVSSRTPAPPLYVGAIMALCAYCFVGAALDAASERWAHAAFALLNGVLFAYAIANFVGLRAACEDLLQLSSGERPLGHPRSAAPALEWHATPHRSAFESHVIQSRVRQERETA